MQQTFDRRSLSAPAVLGLILIVVGGSALILREAGLDPSRAIGDWGWPFFVIVPGLVLLLASLIPTPPKGLGFATAGAVITTVGGLLLYQSQTGHWESWAYAWALIPAAAGVAMALYGLLAKRRSIVNAGLWMAGIAGTLFLVGAWYFEGIFRGDPRFAQAGDLWPVAIVAIGVALVLRVVVLPARAEPRATEDQTRETPPI